MYIIRNFEELVASCGLSVSKVFKGSHESSLKVSEDSNCVSEDEGDSNRFEGLPLEGLNKYRCEEDEQLRMPTDSSRGREDGKNRWQVTKSKVKMLLKGIHSFAMSIEVSERGINAKR